MLKGKNKSKALKWICNELSRLLRCEIGEDVASQLLAMESKSALENHVKALIDFSSPKAEPFLSGVLELWEEDHKDEKKNPLPSVQKNKNDASDVHAQNSPSKSGKKTNFVPLFGTDGKDRTAAKLPGRHACECQASKHDLVNNCIECGRIVCEQEGSGPCFFCGNLVCSSREEQILSSHSKKGQRLRDQLMSRSQFTSGNLQDSNSVAEEENLKKAIEHKEKLLEFDKNSVKRTRVIDDENDYFTTTGNKWLNDEEKKLLQKKGEEQRAQRFASRLGPCKVTFDFANKKVFEVEPENYDATEDAAVMAANFGTGGRNEKRVDEDAARAGLEPFDMKAEFIREVTRPLSEANGRISAEPHHHLKVIQDGDLQMSLDQGKALSMHQPWASLLVAGIKKHEGRTWYTNHRGPLWIASTVKIPDPKDVENVEAMYRSFYGKKIKFPDTYQRGVILGRVVVTDCLPQEEYRVKYPNGESDSPYVFICDNPLEMKINLPIRGQHKIYNLDAHIHAGAKKMLDWKEL